MSLTQQPAGMAVNDLYPSRKQPEPQLIPRQDPVLYSEWAPDSPISKVEAEFYEQNGYLFMESFFSEAELVSLKDELRRLWTEGRDSTDEAIIKEPDSDEVRSIFNIHRSNEIFQRLSQHPRLVGIAQFLLGGLTYIHQSRINFKPGFTGKEFYWHSDFETWHVEDGMPRMRALSCSIALEDNYSFNGSLMVVPGSHHTFVACVGETPDNHYKSSLRKQQYGIPDDESLTRLVQESRIDMPVGKAGSVLFFDCNVMHGSSSNISPYPRSNVFLVFNSVDNRLVAPFSGQKPRPEYIASRE